MPSGEGIDGLSATWDLIVVRQNRGSVFTAQLGARVSEMHDLLPGGTVG